MALRLATACMGALLFTAACSDGTTFIGAVGDTTGAADAGGRSDVTAGDTDGPPIRDVGPLNDAAVGRDTSPQPDGGREDTVEDADPDARRPRDGAPDGDPTDTGDDVAPEDVGGVDAGGREDVSPPECGVGVSFTGQVDRLSSTPVGGPAGLDAAVEATTPGGDVTSVSIPITNAIVSATEFGDRAAQGFWLQSGGNAIRVYLDPDDPEAWPPFLPAVGDVVSFTATAVLQFFGAPQIAAGTGWARNGSGSPVYVRSSSRALTASDVNAMVRVTGEVTEITGSCGEATCYQLAYGTRQTIVLRSRSALITEGACLTYAGPLSLFDGTPQLDTRNFDWLLVY